MREKGTRPRAVPATTKFRFKLNLWGGISFKGPSPFICFEQNLNAEKYKRILIEGLVPFALENNLTKIHQDNDKKHSSSLCTQVLKDFELKWVILRGEF